MVAPRPVHAPESSQSFRDLGLPSALCDALETDGITSAFPIQAATLADARNGRDVLGRGRTGSGKTLAFVLPVLCRLDELPSERVPKQPRALILAPTRELVRQIAAAIDPLAAKLGMRATTVFGGVPAGAQISALRRGVDIVVACPGRLEDLMGSGHVRLDGVQITVLDEADHMADLGFLPSVTRLLRATPQRGQRLLFSATLDGEVDKIVTRFLHDPVTHSVDDATSAVDTMEHHVFHIKASDRLDVLVDLTSAPGRTMVFARTKHRARQLTRQLNTAGVAAVEMHGNLTQGARVRNLEAFTSGRATTMVATDIAARGIHVDGIERVVHADPPIEHKAYLHRSGRTARAGASGIVVTLATEEQRAAVKRLGRKAGIDPTVTTLRAGHPLLDELAPGERVLLSADELRIALNAGSSRQDGAKRNGGDARQGTSRPGSKNRSRRRHASQSPAATANRTRRPARRSR
jgi:superfamily II DNA/RNA helicase